MQLGTEPERNYGVLTIHDDILGKDQQYVVGDHFILDGKSACRSALPPRVTPRPGASGRVILPTFVEGYDPTGRYDWTDCIAPPSQLPLGAKLVLVYWVTNTTLGTNTRFTDQAWSIKP